MKSLPFKRWMVVGRAVVQLLIGLYNEKHEYLPLCGVINTRHGRGCPGYLSWYKLTPPSLLKTTLFFLLLA